MQNATAIPTFNTNPYVFTQQPLPSPVVSAPQAPSPAPVNNFYPLNNTSLTGPVGGDALNLSTMGAPTATNYTTTPQILPAPFKAATVKPDPTSITLDMNALLNPTTPAVQPVPPVVANPFTNNQTTTIPGYPGQPGQQLSMLA